MPAQTDSTPPKPAYGFVIGQARELMSSEWDDTNPYQVERAYCGWYGIRSVESATLYIVKYAAHATVDTTEAPTRNSVSFRCPEGSIAIHTHVPSTCDDNDPTKCAIGGVLAYQCFASARDLEIPGPNHPFTVVQCDRNAFVFYFRGQNK